MLWKVTLVVQLIGLCLLVILGESPTDQGKMIGLLGVVLATGLLYIGEMTEQQGD